MIEDCDDDDDEEKNDDEFLHDELQQIFKTERKIFYLLDILYPLFPNHS